MILTQNTGLNLLCQQLAAFILAALLAVSAFAEEPPPLKMGVLPYLSSELLFKNYLPMKDYLETKLNRRVIMITAPDFKTFVQRAERGDYDIYVTAPHFALLAEAKQGFRRVCSFSRKLIGDVVVRRDSPIKRLEDLRGHTVITPDALAITSILGEQLLEEHGLHSNKDYQLKRSNSHNNAILTVSRGAADAALTTASVFEQLSPEVKRKLRILATTRAVPPLMIMTHPRLSQTEYEQIKSSLLAFTSDGRGQNFVDANGTGNMGPINDADMQRLRPFLKETQERLK